MSRTVLIEVPVDQEHLVRQMLVWSEEMMQLGQIAPDGSVLEACETAVVQRGREIQQQVLAEAVARRIETAEKKGRRSDNVRVDAPKKIAVPRPAKGRPPSG